MIHGFEKETSPLTADEKKVVPKIIAQLKKCTDIETAKTNKDLRFLINYESSDNLRDARVRKLINHIRRNNKLPLLVATAKGYYVSEDIDQIQLYIMSLHQRAQAIQAVARAVQKQCDQLKHDKKWVDTKPTVTCRNKHIKTLTPGKRYKVLKVSHTHYWLLNNAGKVSRYSRTSFATPKKKNHGKGLSPFTK